MLCYQVLSALLPPEWGLFGLQARGLLDHERPYTSVEEMAASYVREVVAEQPSGPYYLLGWSIGGKIAHEVARQLEERGERVALVAMIDTDPIFLPGAPQRFTGLRLALFGLAMLLTHGRMVQRNIHVLQLGTLWPPLLWRRLRLWTALVHAAMSYRPARHALNSRVVLLQTPEGARRELRLRDKRRSIVEVVKNLARVPISGHHVDLFTGPSATRWYEALRPFLEGARESVSPGAPSKKRDSAAA